MTGPLVTQYRCWCQHHGSHGALRTSEDTCPDCEQHHIRPDLTLFTVTDLREQPTATGPLPGTPCG